MIKRYLFFVLSLLFLLYTNSYAIDLKSNHPDRYVVQQGDTLWTIASKFLHKPWQWQQIWRSNPSIQNPDRIYPGDVLTLRQINGQPHLQIVKDGMVKLSPRVREESIDNAIPTIPLSLIKPFLNNSQVLPDESLTYAPYIVAYAEDHLLAGPGDRVYVNELNDGTRQTYTILRPDLIYIDPVSDEVLGFLALYVGAADMINPGKPAAVKINSIKKGVEIGDRVVSLVNAAATTTTVKAESIIETEEPGNHIITIWEEEFTPYFEPHPPAEDIEALIIDMFGGITQIATNQVVVINKGRQDKLEIGNVLTINKTGHLVQDPFNKKEKIQLPDEPIGEVMIFRVFDRVSFGLIMRALEPVRKLYLATNP